MLPEDLALTPAELTKLFKAAGYGSHQKAAEALGVDKSTIGKWCRGELKLSEESAAAIRALQCAPGAERSWNTYLAEVPITIATLKARIPTPSPAPEPRRTLLKQNANEVADAVMAKAAELFATVKNSVDALALSVKNGLDTLTEVVQGLSSKVDSQSTQDAEERAQDRAKRDELGNGVRRIEAGVQQLQAKAVEVGNGVRRIEARVQGIAAKADDLGNGIEQLQAQVGARDGQSARRHRVMLGSMMVGFAGLAVLLLACTAYLAGRPVPGDGPTRGGGVAEDAARGGQQGSWKSWNPEGNAGGRKMGDPVPHTPLPGQAVAPCRGSATTLYGSCWNLSGYKAPCPPDLFQEGNDCYSPILAKPNTPRSTEPKQPGQEMPSREQNDAGMLGKEP